MATVQGHHSRLRGQAEGASRRPSDRRYPVGPHREGERHRQGKISRPRMSREDQRHPIRQPYWQSRLPHADLDPRCPTRMVGQPVRRRLRVSAERRHRQNPGVKDAPQATSSRTRTRSACNCDRRHLRHEGRRPALVHAPPEAPPASGLLRVPPRERHLRLPRQRQAGVHDPHPRGRPPHCSADRLPRPRHHHREAHEGSSPSQVGGRRPHLSWTTH